MKALPFAAWPEADEKLWLDALETGDRFSGRGKAAHWSIASQNSIRYAYGRWLAYIDCEHPENFSGLPANRFTQAIIRQYVEKLQNEVSASTVFIYLDQLLCGIQAMLPDKDISQYQLILRSLRRDIKPKAKHHRIVDSSRLFGLGLSLMDQAMPNTSRSIDKAIQYRDGLIIALLAARPIRRRTLTCISIAKQLQQVGGLYHLVFSANDTKNKKPVEYVLPELLTDYIDRYLKFYRLIFPASNQHDGLWASAKGNPLSSSSIYVQILKRTKEAFGQSVNPHLFRDCAATTIATNKPDQVLVGAGLLGHSDLRAIHSHYIHAQTIKAGKAHQSTIAALRLKGVAK